MSLSVKGGRGFNYIKLSAKEKIMRVEIDTHRGTIALTAQET